MCGIAGLLPVRPLPAEDLQLRVRRMTDALVHRGPDDSGEFIAPQVGLGMRRLAIIDRAHGQQPMASDDGRLVLVFNGEIYNYRELKQALAADGCTFRTQSDTEVVLRTLERQGIEGISRLEGMFCFAVWDRAT